MAQSSHFHLGKTGFDRHSFLCGQSGSGKTFALGVILEQLLLKTDLKIIIIDPNSDFIKLDQLRTIEDVNRTRSVSLLAEQYESIRKRYSAVKPSLLIMRPKGQVQHAFHSLGIRFSDLEPHEQEAVFRLDPLVDREECHLFWNTIAELFQRGDYSLDDVYTRLRDQSVEYRVERITQRIDNLRIADWKIWCSAMESSLVDALKGEWRCLVVDIGMLPSPQNYIIGMAILGHFWRNREQRSPVLIVIDEAHHICPQ